jgi:uncharacterized protein YbjQ (UPF0145 family)
VPPSAGSSWFNSGKNMELSAYTHALYDARELAIERLQAEAEDVGATGIVGVTVTDQQHSWSNAYNVSGGFRGEMIEFFVVGTAVVPMDAGQKLPVPAMVIDAGVGEEKP